VGEQGRYLYAVCRGLTPEAVDGIVGLSGGRIDLVMEGDLVGLVSPVDLDEYGEDGLRRNLERLDWLEEAARGHDAVVQAAAAIAPTAPTRLATIFLDDEGVRRRLRERRDAIAAALDRVEGHEEWSVKVLTRVADTEPEPVPVASSGADYLRRKREQQEARFADDHDAHFVAERVHDALVPVVSASRRLSPQDPRLAGHEGTMVHNAAYLVHRDRSGEFVDRVQEQSDAYPGVVVDARGPWPPYSFAMLDES
jgi:Gas vesicle synthesis protein GvpL/GvpF